MLTPGIFKANDIRGIVTGDAPEWDAAGAYTLGVALVGALELPAGAEMVLGRDMRTTSPEFARAFAEGVVAQGVDVVDIGLASTDQLWFASGRLDRPGAMFTASHNPGDYNGVKFCLPGARPISPALLSRLAELAAAPPPAPAAQPGRRIERDLLADYAAHLHSLVDLSESRRLRVVADAGNGMAGHTLPAVLGVLDLELIGLYTDPDGAFPNHPANPLEPENLQDAAAAVREHGADLALVFDGDADRCFILDEGGDVVTPSVVTAMIASSELRREPGATIVCNALVSRSVPVLVERLGGRPVITKVGHTFVKAAMAEQDAVFGGEHSAHYYFRDFWGADTGMLAALHVLAQVGGSDEPLSQLAAGYAQFVESGEINSRVSDATEALARVERGMAGRGQTDRLDGLTVSTPTWRLNVRVSNTEPLVRLNVEAATATEMAQLRDEALDLIRG